MKAAVFTGPGQKLRIEDRIAPSAASGELVLQVAYCGICGSDLHATEPGPAHVPIDTVLGHEFVGTVVEAAAPGWEPGDRAIGIPVQPCADCRAEGECRDRLGIHCPSSRVIGMSPTVPGGYAEFVRIGARQALRVPDGMTTEAAALTEPLAVGAHAVRSAGPLLGRQVLVVGAGPIGIAVILFARAAGARSVVVSELDPVRRDRAVSLGATAGLDPAAGPIGAAVHSLGAGPPEVVFECVGAPGLLQQCIELAALRARIIVVGVCRSEDRIIPRQALVKELRVQFVLGYVADDFVLGLDLLQSQRVDVAALISLVVGFAELPDIFETLRRPSQYNKVLLDPSRP